MFRTLTAKYPGTCKRCGRPFEKGTTIRYDRGKAYHMAAECPAGKADNRPADPAAGMTNYADELHDHGFLYGERE